MVALIVPAFIAGIFMFLAPCTLPLVPGYLAFISGASLTDLENPTVAGQMRKKVFMNGLFYVAGFSVVFILMGSLFGLGGAALVKYRSLFTQIGGVFVVMFGLYMMHAFTIPFVDRFLQQDHRVRFTALKPGNPTSSLIFGATFAFGWSPCVGPILGSVLLLASSTATVGQGALLLAVFALGLAVPFLLLAYGIGSAMRVIRRAARFLRFFSFIGGVFLVILGGLMIFDHFGLMTRWFYQLFSFLHYEKSLLDFL
ncbi:MAG: cytochrome c biogenesis protein CcdA [Patescibacteria group bacterium]|jgi:cytochrome c-type biogenesis protein